MASSSKKCVETAKKEIGSQALAGIVSLCLIHLEPERERLRKDKSHLNDWHKKSFDFAELLSCMRCKKPFVDNRGGEGSHCKHCPSPYGDYRYYDIEDGHCFTGLCEDCHNIHDISPETRETSEFWCVNCNSPACWRVTDCKKIKKQKV